MPWRRAWQPTPAFLPGESHGQRSLAGYSPRGHSKVTGHARTQFLRPLFKDPNRSWTNWRQKRITAHVWQTRWISNFRQETREGPQRKLNCTLAELYTDFAPLAGSSLVWLLEAATTPLTGLRWEPRVADDPGSFWFTMSWGGLKSQATQSNRVPQAPLREECQEQAASCPLILACTAHHRMSHVGCGTLD